MMNATPPHDDTHFRDAPVVDYRRQDEAGDALADFQDELRLGENDLAVRLLEADE